MLFPANVLTSTEKIKSTPGKRITKIYNKLEMWANAQRDGRLPNIGGALCSTPQRLADGQYWSAVQ